jgi:hypothetical protein
MHITHSFPRALLFKQMYETNLAASFQGGKMIVTADQQRQ